MVVKREFGDAHLLLVRKPPSSLLDVHLYGHSWEISRLCLFTLRLFVTARPATRAPVTALLLTGSSLHGGPQWTTTDQHRTYRNLCCTWYDAYVPSWQLRIVMWRC